MNTLDSDKRRLQLPTLNPSESNRRQSSSASMRRVSSAGIQDKTLSDNANMSTAQLQKKLADVAKLFKDDFQSPPSSARARRHKFDRFDDEEEEQVAKPLKSPVRESKKKENRWLVPCSVNKATHESISLTINSLFELLWDKDHTTNSSVYGLMFPDTISFHRETNSNPQWYFTSISDGKIYKKNSYNVTTENIYQAMLKKRRKKNKRYMMAAGNSEQDCKDVDVVAFAVFEVGTTTSKRYVRTEFLNEKGLHDLLYNGKTKEQECFIQRFVAPKGEHDHVICVEWTPQVTLIENRINKLQMGDQSIPINDRISAVEHHPNSIVGPTISTTTNTQIQRVCDAIQKHVKHVTLGHHIVRKMSFYMKIDAEGHLWFLYFTSLRTSTVEVEGDTSVYRWIDFNMGNKNIGKVKMPVRKRSPTLKVKPNTTEETHEYYYYSPSFIDNKLSKNLACPNCHRVSQKTRFVDVAYRVAIAQFEQEQKENISDHDEPLDEIPPLILSLESSLGPVRYRKMRGSDVFMNKTFKVCPSCGDSFAKIAHQFGMNILGEQLYDEPDKERMIPSISARIVELAQSKHISMSLLREESNTRLAYMYSQKIVKPEDESPLTAYPRLEYTYPEHVFKQTSPPKIPHHSPPKPVINTSPKARHISPPKVYVRGKKKDPTAEEVVDYQAEHDMPSLNSQKGKPVLVAKLTRPLSGSNGTKRKEKKKPPSIEVYDSNEADSPPRKFSEPSKLEVIKLDEQQGTDEELSEQTRLNLMQQLEEERAAILSAVRNRMGSLSNHIFNQDGSFKNLEENL